MDFSRGEVSLSSCFWSVTLLSSQIQNRSQSHIKTDGQSVSMSWCQAQYGTFDQRSFFFWFKVAVLSLWGALSDERSGLIICQSTQSTVIT
jgi:hypothetical protein